MGNSFGFKSKTTKIMKINGDVVRFRTPVNAGDVIKDYPGLVLLDSETVKHYGARAKPLEPQEPLKAKRVYFLVEMPKLAEDKLPTRRVRSGINMGAKERLESLKLARRSASDLTFTKSHGIMVENGGGGGGVDPLRVKLRLPKAEVERLMKESKDEAEAAEKIMKLCMEQSGGGGGGNDSGVPTNKGRRKRVGFSEELTVLEHKWT
ncbi:hypothetical protein M8C21_013524 [Ambrosia artemisiifolia]|uniref:Plastid movement impaired 2 n=1 Tax=Ambrosia artemisiifolia TaxID=4212 RepID=A0AAD5C0R3_AMBAR|nr:hypothetical protein M8C21_013524 [Ambrosia artemisiifolia]